MSDLASEIREVAVTLPDGAVRRYPAGVTAAEIANDISKSLGKAALRSLGHSLFKELEPHGVQVSTVAIHGTMATGTPYDHDLVADAYWRLHMRPRGEWDPDFHFKADAADGADPDA